MEENPQEDNGEVVLFPLVKSDIYVSQTLS